MKSGKVIINGDDTSGSEFSIFVPDEELGDEAIAHRILQRIENETEEVSLKNTVNYSENGIELDFNIFREIGFVLSGKFEAALLKIDTQKQRIFSTVPIVDIYEKELFDLIRHACAQSGVPLVHKAFWPEGKKFAVCLTHDVDEIRKTYQYFTRFLKHLKRGELRRGWYQLSTFFTDKLTGRNPYWTFEEIMRIENALNVKSTFFFLNETANVNLLKPATWIHYARRYDFRDPKIAELIKDLAANGWEIGLHGSYDSYRDKEKLQKEKDYLEETLGSTVHGIRQHHLNLMIPETWKYHESIGLEYDTSLGFKGGEAIGFKWGTSFPFHPTDDNEELSLLEIPLAIMDISLTTNSGVTAWESCVKVVTEVKNYGGVLTLLWHHTVFNTDEYPQCAEVYEKLIRVCKEKGAWIATAGELARWWKLREESTLECEYNEI
ncbi:MAG TPA: hypothetical protein ENN68_06800 [Methanomicrobia archaeon]|nr:hypothetical protein [Methanomicrobia archaeon]